MRRRIPGRTLNQIESLTTGAITWESANPPALAGAPYATSGGITGSQVIFASGNLVLAQPY